MESGNPKKYKGLDFPESTRWLLENEPEKFKNFCNGVGSTTSFLSNLLWHITPNTIWGLNITPASDLHDVGYAWPEVFETKEEALAFKAIIDHQFLHNMMKLIDDSWLGVLRHLRRMRAMKYYEAVTTFGEDSFFDGKRIIRG